MRGTEQRDDLVDQTEIVSREHAEAIADDIVEAAPGQIELDVPGLLLGARLFNSRRDRNFAATGLSRERPGSADRSQARAAAGAEGAAGALSISS